LEEGCSCYACRNFTRAYVRHLVNVGEILGLRLITMHNLHCYLDFMKDMRVAIEEMRFEKFRKEFHSGYRMVLEEHTLNVKEKN
jgi:queuine tRNA-ribosyltransferase